MVDITLILDLSSHRQQPCDTRSPQMGESVRLYSSQFKVVLQTSWWFQSGFAMILWNGWKFKKKNCCAMLRHCEVPRGAIKSVAGLLSAFASFSSLTWVHLGCGNRLMFHGFLWFQSTIVLSSYMFTVEIPVDILFTICFLQNDVNSRYLPTAMHIVSECPRSWPTSLRMVRENKLWISWFKGKRPVKALQLQQASFSKHSPTCAQRPGSFCFQLCVSDSNIHRGSQAMAVYPLSKPFRSCFSGGRQISKTLSWRRWEMGESRAGDGPGKAKLIINCLEPVTIRWLHNVLVVLLENVGLTHTISPPRKPKKCSKAELAKRVGNPTVNMYLLMCVVAFGDPIGKN